MNPFKVSRWSKLAMGRVAEAPSPCTPVSAPAAAYGAGAPAPPWDIPAPTVPPSAPVTLAPSPHRPGAWGWSSARPVAAAPVLVEILNPSVWLLFHGGKTPPGKPGGAIVYWENPTMWISNPYRPYRERQRAWVREVRACRPRRLRWSAGCWTQRKRSPERNG